MVREVGVGCACGASEALEVPSWRQRIIPVSATKERLLRPAMKSSSWEEGGAPDREGPSWSEDLATSGL